MSARARGFGGALLGALLACAACGDGTGPGDVFFNATVTGAVEAKFSGAGWFSQGTPPWGGKTFAVHAEKEAAGLEQWFSLRRYDGGRLPEGTYPLALVQGLSPGASGLGAQYARTDSLEALYVADSGTVTITRSSRGAVEGHFSFAGFRYCLRTPPGVFPEAVIEGPCQIPAAPPPGAARITVTGSFATGPADTRGVPDLP